MVKWWTNDQNIYFEDDDIENYGISMVKMMNPSMIMLQ